MTSSDKVLVACFFARHFGFHNDGDTLLALESPTTLEVVRDDHVTIWRVYQEAVDLSRSLDSRILYDDLFVLLSEPPEHFLVRKVPEVARVELGKGFIDIVKNYCEVHSELYGVRRTRVDAVEIPVDIKLTDDSYEGWSYLLFERERARAVWQENLARRQQVLKHHQRWLPLGECNKRSIASCLPAIRWTPPSE